ncbi:MAG TPA: methyltransferase [Caulobacterales bacterium]|nr:methyltransferase [Caulobacterales bacterium]
MRILLAAACVALSACAGGVINETFLTPHDTALTATSPNITAAIADTRRPDADRMRDDARHAAETLAFANIRPGAKVGELMPGGGYFTRLFAVAVGDSGKVYPVIRPPETASRYEHVVGDGYANVAMVRQNFAALNFPEPLDVVFTAQNYHDFHLAEENFDDPAAINRAVFAALKPGGLYVIIDHSARDGSGLADNGLHRIDQALVRREVEAAGFVFDGESQVLRNPQDARTLGVFDAAIRGHTDQFVMRFRKPG